MAKVSNNKIAAGLVGALVVLGLVSILSVTSPVTITGLTYGQVNVTVSTDTDISVPVSSVSFGSKGTGDQDDTTDGSPAPIQVQNDGNVAVDVVVTGSLWNEDLFPTYTNTTLTIDDHYFSVKCGDGEVVCGAGSIIDWVYVPALNNNTEIIGTLPYAAANDQVELEVNITIPDEASAGAKSVALTLTSSAS